MGHGASLHADDGSCEKFDPSGCPLVSQDLSEGYYILSQTPSSRLAFIRFVKNGSWMKHLSLSQFISQRAGCVEQATGEITRRIDAYLLPKGALPGIEHCLSKRKFAMENFRRSWNNLLLESCEGVEASVPGEDRDSHRMSPQSVAAVEKDFIFSDDQMKDIIFAYLLPLFLQSQDFADWMANVPTQPQDMEGVEEEKTNSFSSSPEGRFCAAVMRVAGSLATKEMEDILQSGNWMEGFIASVEHLDLCVTLSSLKSSPDGESFPLIYVNQAFEAMTGYHREEVLGKNCRFLQCARTEAVQVQKLREGLRMGKSVKVAITNARKDGSEFLNLLAVVPVANAQNNSPIYYIGVQYDVSKPDACKQDLKKIDDLLNILPRILQ